MREKIVKALEAEAERHDCRILIAVESGSRAWGFASPDSDYDVRVVYVKRLDWYLGLEEAKADTWEAMLPGDIDGRVACRSIWRGWSVEGVVVRRIIK